MEFEKQNDLTQGLSDFSFSDASVVPQSKNASEENGFICVAYYGLCDKSLESEKKFYDWSRAGEELEDELKILRDNTDKYCIHDCKISLAEYRKPELKSENISEIKSLVLRIFHNEKFYFSEMKDAAEYIMNRCRIYRIPEPNEILCIVNGYQIKWNFENGFRNNEISLWKFMEKKLHEIFSDIGSDASICDNATEMILVPGILSSEYAVPFDLCEKITTVYENSELYASPSDFISRLQLSVSEIAEYRKVKAKKSRSEKGTQNQSAELAITEKTAFWIQNISEALRVENCANREYRYYQYGTAEDSKKNYKWLEINGNGTLPNFDAEVESWISAANYFSRFRRKSNVAEIDCNFLIINWKKSELGFTPTPEQGRELVLSRCHELGLPEPNIVSTPDGLEIKWHWKDRMTKILYGHDPYNSNFNKDWDLIQKKLFERFWTLGADSRKLCVTTMFRIPGSKDTRKSLKTDDNARIIREIHKGEVVESYRDIQRALGLEETYYENNSEVFEVIDQEKWDRFSADNSEIVKDWLADVLKIHQPSKNWICFGFIDGNKVWNNRWTQAFELRKFLMNIIRKPEFNSCDFYVSQGEFFSRGDRHVDNLASVNVNFVDLDYKILVDYRPEISENPSPEEWKKIIIEHCGKFGIPLPNDVVFSGGGVHLKWIYDKPVERTELELWQYAQRLLLSQFKTLGADPNSSDAARVLRLVGTVNHKNSPIVKDRNVRVIDREFFSKNKIALGTFVEDLEKSKPENPEEFNAVKSEWQRILAQLSISEANMLRPNAEKINYDSEDFKKADEYYWLESTLRHHKLHATFLAADVSGVEKWIETYQLHGSLKMIYGTPNFKLSLAELKAKERIEKREAIEWIPCNYVVLSHCPGKNFEEQKENIFRRCREYREIGFPEPNQIIKIGNTLLVEWTYQSVLTGRALPRWHDTQEFICRHFEDWGAMESPECLKATALLPVPGFVYDGETARLEYSNLKKRYTFNTLANAVLHFSQKEVEEYRKRKEAEKAEKEAKRKPAPKISLPENISEKLKIKNPFSKFKYADFKEMARLRYNDIIKFLDLQREADGEIPQNTRELCCFWALNFARQAGMVTNELEFEIKAEELINFCGVQFPDECTIATLKSSFRKHYSATTDFLIDKLRITPEFQKKMSVLKIGIRTSSKKRQPRAEWLAEHSQEREMPWKKLGIGRTKYFELKKSGDLLALQENNESYTRADRYIYIMSAHYMLLLMLYFLESLILISDLESEKVARAFFASTLTLLLSGLLYFNNPALFNLNALLFSKRKKRVKRKRRRKKKACSMP